MTESQGLEPPAAPATREGILERSIGVFVSPVQTLRAVAAERAVGQAIPLLLLASAVGFGVALEPYGRGSESGAAWILGGVVLGLLVGIPIYALWTGICHLAVRMLGRQGPYSGLFAAFGFASVVGLVQAPLAVIGAIGGPVSILSGVGSLVVTIWLIVLEVLALRENYHMGTGPAIGALVLAFVGVLLFFLVLAVLVIALILLGLFAAVR